MRIAVVGTGPAARAHARAFQGLSGTTVEVVVGRALESARQAAEEVGATAASDCFTDVLDSSGIDAIVLAVPPRLQPDLAVQAFDAGLHVLCEKPLAVSVAEARRVHRAWQASGRVGMVNFCYRLIPEIQELKRLIREGELGHLQSIHVDWVLSNRLNRSLTQHWKGQGEHGGGVIQNFGSHVLDYLFHDAAQITLRGVERRVFVETRPDDAGVARPSSGEEVASAIYRLNGDSVAMIHLSLVSAPALGHRIVARGSDGTVDVFNPDPASPGGPFRLRRYAPGETNHESSERVATDGHGLTDLFTRAARRFYTSIQEGSQPTPSIECGLRVVEQVDELRRASPSA